MASKHFVRFALTGGAVNALDGIDGNRLSDGDTCDVATSTGTYKYRVNATSAAAEASPLVISPDTNAGNKRWILTGVILSSAQVITTSSTTGFEAATELGASRKKVTLSIDTSYAYLDAYNYGGSTSFPLKMQVNGGKTLFGAGYVGFNEASPACQVVVNGGMAIGDNTAVADNNLRVVGDVSALTFTDRTPFFQGDALAEIKKIKGKDGEIDHSSLPDFAKKTHKYDIVEDKFLRKEKVKNEQGESVEVDIMEPVKVGEKAEEVRDLGAMISLLTVAVQQLSDRLDAIEKKGASK